MEDESIKIPILEIKGISKHFGGVIALDNIDFKLVKGEVLGIVGDNGAGKSTLIKIISGVLQKDRGEIFYKGKKVEIHEPKDAKRIGIETVYQDLALVDLLDIAANIFIGRELKYKGFFGKVLGFLDFKKMHYESENFLKKLQVNVEDLNSKVIYLSGGQRQAVAIVKGVYWGKEVIILDEPTSALGVKESKKVLELIKRLKEHNISVIIISHNLQHIFNVVDRIMVLRRGKKVGIKEAYNTSADEIIKMITGAEVIEKV